MRIGREVAAESVSMPAKGCGEAVPKNRITRVKKGGER